MPPLRLERSLLPAMVTAALVFALFEVTTIDLAVQDRLFDFSAGTWMIDRNEPVARALFYTGPKVVLALLGLALLVAVVRPPRGRSRRPFATALLTLGGVPLIVGWGKDVTNVFCPWDNTRYGGQVPYVRVIERFPDGTRPARRGRGFPAGHASGGFALVGLAALARTRREQLSAIALAAIIGGTMGGYQMAKGAHYLSHTVVTALLAWILFLVVHRLLLSGQSDGERQAAPVPLP